MNLTPSQRRVLVDAEELRRERETGKIDRAYRTAADFADSKEEFVSCVLLRAGLVAEDGSITDAGRVILKTAP